MHGRVKKGGVPYASSTGIWESQGVILVAAGLGGGGSPPEHGPDPSPPPPILMLKAVSCITKSYSFWYQKAVSFANGKLTEKLEGKLEGKLSGKLQLFL